MKHEPTLHLLFNHTLTPSQEADAFESLAIGNITYFPDELLGIWKSIPPQEQHIKKMLSSIYAYLKQSCQKGDYILIQGDAGATYLLVQEAFTLGLIPVYATTKRISVEKMIDAKQVKTSVFEHSIFRKYGA